jgi:NarL family two-component system response regulator LiaR
MGRITVFHADDHALVRGGVYGLLLTEPDIDLVGEASNGEEAVEKALALQPDVILLDLHMPKKGGIESITEIRQEWPEARILVLTSFATDEDVFPAIKAGALGYLLKDSSPQDLLRAIRDVYHGQLSLDPVVAQKVMLELRQPRKLPLTEEPLTQREVEILKLLAEGLTNQEIADSLVVSERTVRAHVSNILAKLHLANRTQAALYALREGIASLDEPPGSSAS